MNTYIHIVYLFPHYLANSSRPWQARSQGGSLGAEEPPLKQKVHYTYEISKTWTRISADFKIY